MRPVTLFGLLVFSAFAALSASSVAAEPPPAPFSESIDVRVVNVEAVVTGRDGQRVRGLIAADFRLLVDGREVPVEYFTEIADGAALPAVQAAPPEQTFSPPAPAAGAAGKVGRNFLIFIDESFSIAAQRNMVLRGLERDFALLGPEDSVALVAFDGMKLTKLSGWVRDPAARSAALEAARRRPARGHLVLAERRWLLDDMEVIAEALGSASGAPILDGPAVGPAASMAVTTEIAYGGVEPKHYSWILRAVNAAAAAVRGFPAPPPGRKALILLSGGWPLPNLAASLAQEANRVGYTIYPVDVPGIDVTSLPGDANVSRPTLTAMFTSSWEQGAHATLETLAEATGGRAALNSARLGAFARAVEDTSSYYWLGFTPAWRADDRRHRIQVVPRRPGLAVRSRLGFSDLSPQTEAALRTESLLLFGESGEGAAGLKISLGTPQRTGMQTFEQPVTLEIPVEALTPVPEAAGWVAEATLSLGALDRWGARSDLPSVPVRLVLPAAPRPGDKVRWTGRLQLRRVEQRLVFSLRDRLSGAVVWNEIELRP